MGVLQKVRKAQESMITSSYVCVESRVTLEIIRKIDDVRSRLDSVVVGDLVKPKWDRDPNVFGVVVKVEERGATVLWSRRGVELDVTTTPIYATSRRLNVKWSASIVDDYAAMNGIDRDGLVNAMKSKV